MDSSDPTLNDDGESAAGTQSQQSPWVSTRPSPVSDYDETSIGGGDAAIEDAARRATESNAAPHEALRHHPAPKKTTHAESGGALVDLSRKSWQSPNTDSLENLKLHYLEHQSSLANKMNTMLQKTKTEKRGGPPVNHAPHPSSPTSRADNAHTDLNATAVERMGPAIGGSRMEAMVPDVESGRVHHLARSSLHEHTQKTHNQERRHTLFSRIDSRRERRGTKVSPSGGGGSSPMRSSIASSHNVMEVVGSSGFNNTKYRYKHQRTLKLERIISTSQRALENADDENISKVLEREYTEENSFYIDPDGVINYARQALITGLAVFTAVWLPVFLVMGLLERPAVLAINIVIDVVFIINMPLCFFVALRESPHDYELITDLGVIASRYLRGGFLLDLIISIPWDVIYLITGSSSPGIQLLRCLRLLRLKNSGSIFSSSTNVGMLFRQLAVLFASGHFSGCLWWGTAALEGYPQREIFYMYGGSQFLANTRAEVTFIGDRQMKSGESFADFAENYMYMLFWGMKAATSFTSFVYPSTLLETTLCVTIIFIGLLAVSYVLGAIFEVISSLSSKSKAYRDYSQEVTHWFRTRNVDEGLKRRILEYRWLKQDFYNGVNEESLLAQMPDTLRRDVTCLTRSPMIMQNVFLRSMPSGLIMSICDSLAPELFVAFDIVLTAGEDGSKMYFIDSGLVDVIRQGTNDSMAVLKRGDFFGEIALLMGITRTAHVQTSCITELFALHARDLERLLAVYPAFSKLLVEVAGERVRELREKEVEEEEEEEQVEHVRAGRWSSIASFARRSMAAFRSSTLSDRDTLKERRPRTPEGSGGIFRKKNVVRKEAWSRPSCDTANSKEQRELVKRELHQISDRLNLFST